MREEQVERADNFGIAVPGCRPEQNTVVLARCVARMLAADRPADELGPLGRALTTRLGCDVSLGLLVEGDEERLRVAWVEGLSADESARLTEQATTTFTSCVSEADGGARLARLLGVDDVIARRLEVGGRLLGCVAFGSRRGAELDTNASALVAGFAEVATAALERSAQERARQAALEERERRFRQVVEHVQDGLMIDDRDGRVVFANDRFCALFGLRREELAGIVLEDYVAPEYREALRERHDRRIRGEDVPARFEYQGVRRDGSRVWLEVDVVPVHGEDGAVIGTQSALRDIGERKRAEQALRESEERLRLTQEAAQLGSWDYDIRAGRVVWSGQCPPIFGDDIGRLTFERVLAQVHPVDRDRWCRDVERALDGGSDGRFAGEYSVLWLDGSTRWFSARGQAYFEGDGQQRRPVRFAGVVQDVTERRRAEEALRASEAKLRGLYDTRLLGVIFWRADGSIADANDQFLRMVGYTRADLAAGRLDWRAMTPPEQRERDEAAMRELRAHGVDMPYEKDYLRPDGTRVPVLIGAAALDDQASHGLAFAIDISRQKHAEEALRESHAELECRVRERTAELAQAHERLRALSRRVVEVQEAERRAVARELHDEAGQGLTALLLALGGLQRAGAADWPAIVERMNETVRQVMDGIHATSARLRPAALERLGLHGALRALADMTAEQVAISVDAASLEGRVLPLEVEATVYRVVQESVTNVVRHAHASRATVVVDCEGERVSAAVEDDGEGFDLAAAHDSGRLGLLGMQERAELLGGSLVIDSEPGRGTRVRLELPLGRR